MPYLERNAGPNCAMRDLGPEPANGSAHAVPVTAIKFARAAAVSQATPPRSLFSRDHVTRYAAVLAAAGLAACATVPAGPTPEMTRAESQIEQAQRAGAGQYAIEPLASAQRHLDAAKSAVVTHDNVRAARLVDESYADARLAELTAQSVKSEAAASEVDASIRTLETETTRPRSP
jgi:hypothetical protein